MEVISKLPPIKGICEVRGKFQTPCVFNKVQSKLDGLFNVINSYKVCPGNYGNGWNLPGPSLGPNINWDNNLSRVTLSHCLYSESGNWVCGWPPPAQLSGNSGRVRLTSGKFGDNTGA